jgi:hypothetical protein
MMHGIFVRKWEDGGATVRCDREFINIPEGQATDEAILEAAYTVLERHIDGSKAMVDTLNPIGCQACKTIGNIYGDGVAFRHYIIARGKSLHEGETAYLAPTERDTLEETGGQRHVRVNLGMLDALTIFGKYTLTRDGGHVAFFPDRDETIGYGPIKNGVWDQGFLLLKRELAKLGVQEAVRQLGQHYEEVSPKPYTGTPEGADEYFIYSLGDCMHGEWLAMFLIVECTPYENNALFPPKAKAEAQPTP